MTGATLDLVTNDDAQLASSALHPEGRIALSYGELAELIGEFERALCHDGKALALCAGDRHLPTLLAYLTALRLGHAVAFLPASSEIISVCRPKFVVPVPGSETGLADLGYRPAAEPVAYTKIFQRKGNRPACEIYIDTALLLAAGLDRQPQGGTAIVFRARQHHRGHPCAGHHRGRTRPDLAAIAHAHGLSVLNTHLLAGAGVVLGDRSPLSLPAASRGDPDLPGTTS